MRAQDDASRSGRRAARSKAAVAQAPAARLRWARVVVAAAFTAGLLLAPRLFLATRVYPRVPVLDGWPPLAAPFDAIIVGALLAALGGVALAPRPPAGVSSMSQSSLLMTTCDPYFCWK